MKGDAVRLRLGTTISVALLVGVTIAGSTAGARPAPIGSIRAARPNAAPDHKVPWGSGVARVVPHQIVVVWKPGAALTAERALSARLGTTRVAPTPALGVDVVRIPAGRSVGATLRAFRRSPLVRSAEPDRIATISTTDTHFVQQWALENTGQTHRMTDQGGPGTSTSGNADADVDAPEAWADLTQHDPVVVAVLDTGVDIDHPDLVDRMWVNAAEQLGTGTPGVDDDLNGFKDDVNGWDFQEGDADPTPKNGIGNSHGTHVAGIVAAEQDNAEGISGVCPDCQIMALRIGTANTLSLGAELKAINYAIANGADVINMSFGSSVWSKSERSAINKAGKHGVLVVIAAGNGSSDNDIQFYDADGSHAVPASAPAYPATYTLKNILAVAATNDRDNYGYFSQCRGQIPLWACGFTSWGHDSVDVAAPGADILSTFKVGQGTTFPNYEFFDGTSMATPLVAGIAGLVLSEHSGYSAIQVKNAIMNSVNRPDSLKLYDSWADVVGLPKKALTGRFTRTQGRVNAFKALTAPTTIATPKTDGNIDHARRIRARRTGSVGWPADANDVFKRKLAKGAKYQVVLNGPKGRDFDLWVWRPGTKEIFQFTAGCFRRGGACPALEAVSAGRTADEAVTFKAPKSGVFYIQVNGWYSGGNYTLTVKKI
jgi:subtilisin family serine protease